MRGAKFFGIGIALAACVLVMLLAGEAGFIPAAWADKPDNQPGQGKKPPKGERLPWGVERVRANEVWDTDGNLRVDPGAVTGFGIRVAVPDTGIDSDHSDLTFNQANGISTVGDGTGSYEDTHRHGTMIAGIIAAADNDLGVIGVAPEADIYVAKFCEESGVVTPDPGFNNSDLSTYTFTDLYEAMQWCIQQDVQIISMSIGGIWTVDQDGKREYPLHDPQFYSLIQAAHKKGIVLIAASGNANREIGDWIDEDPPLPHTAYPNKEYDFPASYPEVMGTSATAIETTKGKPSERQTIDVRASFSNFGDAIDLAAPGTSIESTSLNDGYGTGSGTSYASPHVSAVAALVLDQLGYTSPAPGVPQLVKDILTSTAKPIGDSLYFGHGLVDAKAAVDAAAGISPSSRAPARRRATSPVGKLTVTWGELKAK